jgi:hypothetical protein
MAAEMEIKRQMVLGHGVEEGRRGAVASRRWHVLAMVLHGGGR